MKTDHLLEKKRFLLNLSKYRYNVYFKDPPCATKGQLGGRILRSTCTSGGLPLGAPLVTASHYDVLQTQDFYITVLKMDEFQYDGV